MNLFMPSIALDPIHQFKVTKWLDFNVGGIDLSFTNASGFMALGVIMTIAFFGVAASKGQLVPSRLQSLAEIGYGFVADLVRGTAGEEGLKFFPFVFTLFFFVFFVVVFCCSCLLGTLRSTAEREHVDFDESGMSLTTYTRCDVCCHPSSYWHTCKPRNHL